MYRKNDETRQVKKILLLACCFIFVSGFGCLNGTAGELTFKQALEKMYFKNEALKATESAVGRSEYLQKAAQGLYYPKIWVDGKHTRMDDEISIDLNDIRLVMGTLHGIDPQMLPSFESRVQNSCFSTANINFSWMLFTGGKILAANRAADAKILENQEQFLYTKSILTTELVKRYYGYLLSLEAASVYKDMLKGIEQHLSQTRKLEKSGMIAKSERIHAEAAHAEALRKYKKSIRKTEIVQAGLKNTLSSEEIIIPVSPLFLTKKILPLREYLDSAKQENHLLKKLGAKKELAIQGYKAELSSHMPKVYLFGKYELYKNDLTLLDPEWAVGVGVKLSLFEGFSNTYKIMAAKKQKESIVYFKAKAMRDINTLVEKKYNELMMEIEQFEALETSMRFANESLRVHERAFKSGMTTSLNVVDAQLALSKVKIEKLNAVYEFDVVLAELLEVCGLSEKYEDYQ
ncbi:MAG: TolC family protein, partial [Desulfobacteraceae bacterium]|nr:TolC family protein [Desulfobacteraceae bacterium]